MSITYNNQIVSEGLICYLDATNKKSYPGTGNTVYDISGNNKNGTLVGGTNYSVDDGGRFNFDGVNSTISLGTGETFFPMHEVSIEMWFRSTGITPTTGTTPALLGGTYGISCSVESERIILAVNINQPGTTTSTIVTPSEYNFYNGSWNQLVLRIKGTEVSIALNGSVVATLAITHWYGYTNWVTNTFNIGRNNNNSMYFFAGSVSIFRMYKSYLTPEQINLNFQCNRGKYNL